ncbi:PQQ-dependent sugar dehydrogenase [Altererythrobacter xixiisoli]|uniref:PQQ-dependent sugar dehydrogenase n=1 Tax=Croceibacterium xixiisoli TaxID=1476466 RepID=A0A6I4TW05_9SPHN|nr:PQQ-dependent sugar dehydrogenase [Croceibacterium xixiisoli]MXO99301.1 PQQ-dependent sugar dehydrogenase [Croceibacterium xixiisoli]
MKFSRLALAALLIGTSATAQNTAPTPTPAPAPAPSPRTPTPSYVPQPGMPVEGRKPNAAEQTPAFPQQTRAPYTPSNVALNTQVLAEGLVDPWGLAFLPDGKLLVTERDGRLRVIDKGQLSPPVEGLPASVRQEISGLADVVLDPDFTGNQRIYWSYVEARPAGNVLAVARGRLVDGTQPRLEDVRVIYRQEPDLKSEHGNFGARLLFDKTGALLVTLGDLASTPLRPYIQQLDSGIGKIVRITTDGAPAPGNPFAGQAGARPELWAVGFRNPLGLTFRPGTDQLWEADVGPRGGDEINIIRPGANYGWPLISYGHEYSGGPVGDGPVKAGYEQPVYYWDPVISPSSLEFYSGDLFPQWQGNLFVTSLSQQHLARLVLEGDRVVGEERLLKDLKERLRLVRQAADGALIIMTEGPNAKILRLTPAGG